MENEVYVYLASLIMLFIMGILLFVSFYPPQRTVNVYREEPRRRHWRRYGGVPGFYSSY